MVDGLEYGLNFPVFKSSVTSRKLTTFLFLIDIYIHYEVNQNPQHLLFVFILFFFFSGETLLMRRLKTLASA